MTLLKESYLTTTDKPIANPLIVLREEFDDWAILFDPDTGHAFGLNPLGVFVWQRLDGEHSIQDIISELKESCEDVPGNAQEQRFGMHGMRGFGDATFPGVLRAAGRAIPGIDNSGHASIDEGIDDRFDARADILRGLLPEIRLGVTIATRVDRCEEKPHENKPDRRGPSKDTSIIAVAGLSHGIVPPACVRADEPILSRLPP